VAGVHTGSFASAASAQVSATPVAPPTPGGTPWINEFHYDNSGTDANEFIEIAGRSGTNLAGWTLVGYDGSTRSTYKTVTLSGTLANQSNGFGTRSFAFSGLQNGAPDGFALVSPTGVLVQFLSYEGAFTAANGPAAGRASTAIRQSENGTGPTNGSIRLTGTGCGYASFTWAAPATASQNAINPGQAFSVGCP